MEERISTQLKGKQFFDYGTVIFASNHPDHVYLVEVKNENESDKVYTVLYDKNHDYLNIHKHFDHRNINVQEDFINENIELTEERKQEIKTFLEANGNNVE